MKTWKLQRYSAMLLMPSIVWLIISFSQLSNYYYAALTTWLSQSHIVLLAHFVIISTAIHAYIGIEEVFLDYVHQDKFNTFKNVLTAIMILALIAGIVSLNIIAN